MTCYKTYRLEQLNTDNDNIKIEHMKMDHIEKSDQIVKDNVIHEQISKLSAGVAAIAAALNRPQYNNTRQGSHVPDSHFNHNIEDVNHTQPTYNHPNSKPRFNNYQQQ